MSLVNDEINNKLKKIIAENNYLLDYWRKIYKKSKCRSDFR